MRIFGEHDPTNDSGTDDDVVWAPSDADAALLFDCCFRLVEPQGWRNTQLFNELACIIPIIGRMQACWTLIRVSGFGSALPFTYRCCCTNEAEIGLAVEAVQLFPVNHWAMPMQQ